MANYAIIPKGEEEPKFTRVDDRTVVIGSQVCAFQPTMELRWLSSISGSFKSQKLQQRWVAQARWACGSYASYDEWRDVPVVMSEQN